ncbi:efflux RND transporter permease subunit [Rhodopila globiformis]|uniref:RND transporter n=1 Tax=Rhodopila globiformis TaxID=1071 RepID=A0A2S6N032_RHOGL|nr:efflux RND transporter permease subunit [Rhodopila globiformis]PPQ27983.1 RND transporter [Rhodopila globiformis]
MWIVRLALDRPYTFIVLALLILIMTPLAILRTPTDIFPNIDIPVIAVGWHYNGLNPEEMEGRITTVYERVLTTLVDNIQHIESTTYPGIAIVRIFLQPGASLDTANAQVTAASQTILRGMPPGTEPPLVMNYSASSVPILQLGLSSDTLSESRLNDLALNFARPQLVTVPGAVIPYPYGGKMRQVVVNLDPTLLQQKNLSPNDVLDALAKQNLVLPTGTAKISEFEYDIRLNAAPETLEQLRDLPIKRVGNATIYLRDVASVADGFQPQTNIARADGRRGVLMNILKAGNASTINVVEGIRKVLPRVRQTLPPELKIQPLSDQSVFVKAAISGVVREAILAACLTAAMILLFLGSWRSTLLIAVSIPLSIFTSIIILGFLGQTINIMTLGGLALAVGILVDDATVTIENMERYLEEGFGLRSAILEGAAQIAVPALVSTLCICIVFVPMFMLGGVARYLFVPLAEAVVFAMLASYVLSRTLVPTLALYLLRAKPHGEPPTRNPFVRFQRGFERRFERVRQKYHRLLTYFVIHRRVFIPAFLGGVLCLLGLVPWLGQNFFPETDSGRFVLHMRARSGLRIEETARICDLVEATIRREVGAGQIETITDNIGLPYSTINLTHSISGVIGTSDADIMVTLKPDHRPTDGYIARLRQVLPHEFPSVTFNFLPADIVTQVLNFGLPAPIDIRIEGRDILASRNVAIHILNKIRHVPGIVDAHIQQDFDYPNFEVNVDRTKAQEGGVTEADVANSLLAVLSGSSQTAPMFFLNRHNGVNYTLAAQTPQYRIQSLQDLQNIPITSPTAAKGGVLADYATIKRSEEMAAVDHYNIRRVVDIYASVQGRDLGAAGADVEKIVHDSEKMLPRGTFLSIRGQLETMQKSYVNLLSGLAFSILLVYLLIVVNFQSWLDPFIIIMGLPAALGGIVLCLFFTNTTLSVPALMGAIMCMGVSTANSILVVSFARERLTEHSNAVRAAIEAGFTRFRPVLMTALAMIIGMIPMALGLGEGGEQNAPLGRAVIGGLMLATVATLVFVPALFALLHGRRSAAKSRADRALVHHAQ